jgi:NTP pyrophosphatase (non-canonical NTP hydrolase)
MLLLPPKPTVKEFQEYVSLLEKERGFDKQDILQKCLLLGEEVGELYKAIRKSKTNLRIDAKSKNYMIEEELADILIYLCAIANKYDIDLEKAFRDKEEVNKERVWN